MSRDNYGAHEAAPLDQTTRDFIARAIETGRRVDWTDPNLKRVVRLRLLSDPGFPVWDVSYCFGEMKDSTPVRVSLPFDQLPKRGFRRAIVEYAKQDGVHAARLGLLDNISTLV